MKLFLILLIISLSFKQSIFAQRLNTDDQPHTIYNNSYHLKRHSITTRIGEGFMIGGGAIVALSAVGYVTTVGTGPHLDDELAGLVFVLLGAAGAQIALDGAITFTVGKIYEQHHKDRYSVFSSGNRVGLSYNFR